MNRAATTFFALLFALVWTCVYAQTSPVIIWRWIDEGGKVHFTDNYNTIPMSYRNKASQGRFLPDKPLTATGPTNNGKPGVGDKKLTNKLEVFDEVYFEKDDNLVVTGKVKNGFAQPISNVKIKITFLDDKDRTVRAETTFIEPIQLQSGETGQFTIEVPFTPDIAGYKRDIEME